MTLSLLALLTALGLAFASMAAYAWLGRRPDADAQKKGATFVLGMGDFFVHWFMWVIGPLERALLGRGFGPDAMNLAGLTCGVASGILIGLGRVELGGWAIAAGGVCDILDGRLARARNVVSRYGAFIDSTLDRFVEAFAFLGFVYFLRGFAWGPLLAAAAITGSLLVSYTRARGEGVGILCKEGLMQRAERLVLTCLACLADAPASAALGRPTGTLILCTMALIAAGTFVTAAQRTLWISARLRERG